MRHLISFTVFAFFFFYCITNAKSQSCIDSSIRYNFYSPSFHVNITDHELLSNNNIAITGTLISNNLSDTTLFVSKLDNNNNIQFSKTIQGLKCKPQKIIECSNGDLLILANKNFVENNLRHYIYFLFRFNNNGLCLWQKQLDTLIGSYEIGRPALTERNGSIYISHVTSIENPDQLFFNTYYHNYKIDAGGNIVWKTILYQITSSWSGIGEVHASDNFLTIVSSFYPQTNSNACVATNQKSLGYIKLDANSGTLISSKAYCLNFSDGFIGSAGDTKQITAAFTVNNNWLIAGSTYLPDSGYKHWSLETTENFDLLQCKEYDYKFNPSFAADKNGHFSSYIRNFSSNKLYYAVVSASGVALIQKKLPLADQGNLISGMSKPLLKTPTNLMLFYTISDVAGEKMQLLEFKGLNNEQVNCTGQDTSFIQSQDHLISAIPFDFSNQTFETKNSVTLNYSVADFSFLRNEICTSSSICDSIKIHGADTVCLPKAEQQYTCFRNTGCNKIPLWKIDTAAIQYMHILNDTTITIQFKKAWQGYLYAYNNSCSLLKDSIFIVVHDSLPSINLGADTNFCGPQQLTAPSGYYTYLWQNNSPLATITADTAGVYWVVVSDVCRNYFSDSVILKPAATIINLGNDTCVSSFPILLNAGSGFKQYHWQNNSIDSSYLVSNSGQYFVSAINFCNQIINDTIQVNKKIIPFSLGTDTTICKGSQIVLKAPIDDYRYIWQNGSTDSTYIANNAGEFSVVVTDACSNSFSDSILISTDTSSIKIEGTGIACNYDQTTLKATTGFINYNWKPASSILSAFSNSATVNPQYDTEFFVIAQTINGCTVHDSFIIKVQPCEEDIFIPSAFTPNNDGLNDIFKPIVKAQTEMYHFKIFNRWGQLLFTTKNISAGWDGTINGIQQPNGVYVWLLEYKLKNKVAQSKKGTVMMIR